MKDGIGHEIDEVWVQDLVLSKLEDTDTDNERIYARPLPGPEIDGVKTLDPSRILAEVWSADGGSRKFIVHPVVQTAGDYLERGGRAVLLTHKEISLIVDALRLVQETVTQDDDDDLYIDALVERIN